VATGRTLTKNEARAKTSHGGGRGGFGGQRRSGGGDVKFEGLTP